MGAIHKNNALQLASLATLPATLAAALVDGSVGNVVIDVSTIHVKSASVRVLVDTAAGGDGTSVVKFAAFGRFQAAPLALETTLVEDEAGAGATSIPYPYIVLAFFNDAVAYTGGTLDVSHFITG